MPAGFQYPRGAEIWTPLALNDNQVKMREARFLEVIARRRPSASPAQVRAEMESIAGSLEEAKNTESDFVIFVSSLCDFCGELFVVNYQSISKSTLIASRQASGTSDGFDHDPALRNA